MDKQQNFEENWRLFMQGEIEPVPERLDRYELARLFFEIGFAAGVLK